MKNAVMERDSAPASSSRYATDAARWAAVRDGDVRADGRFFYAVKTTGIYCRPSCASKLPKRDNVRFFDSPGEAGAAGFRPCKRCSPDGASREEDRAAIIAAACRTIEAADTAPDPDTLAKAAGMSRFHFHRSFKAVTGLTPKAYAMRNREARIREALPAAGTVTAAVYDSGYNSGGRFYAGSDKALGMKPSRFRAGGSGETIGFATGRCSLGVILVAATGKGVCAILLGDDPDELVRDLRERFPRADILEAGRDFETHLAGVVDLIESRNAGRDLPLDLRGTIFQHRVWEALRKVPSGKTTTYTALAVAIGSPKSVRAVAGACAANPLAVAVPCHRVLRLDGDLSGYRWGVARKRELLRREASA